MSYRPPLPEAEYDPPRDVLNVLQAAAGDAVRWAFVATAEMLQVRRASLLVSPRDGEPMRVRASIGLDPGIVPDIRVEIGQGIAGLVAERQMTVLGETSGESYICVPVSTPRGVVGVLSLTHRRDGRELTESDLGFAVGASVHLSALLERDARGGIDRQTGLPDRTMAVETLDRELARSRRSGQPFGLLFVRLYSPAGGSSDPDSIDTAIRRVGQALQPRVRRYDTVARVDDGLLVVVSGARDVRRTTGERLLQVSKEAVRPLETGIAVSLGWMECPDDGTEPATLLATVRGRAGRNRGYRDIGDGPLDVNHAEDGT